MTAVMEPTPADRECLMFWYYMEGSGVGDLHVLLQTADGNSEELWSRNGDQGKHWRHARVTLSSGATYQVLGSLLDIRYRLVNKLLLNQGKRASYNIL